MAAMLRNRVVAAGALVVVVAVAVAIFLGRPAPLIAPVLTPGPSATGAPGQSAVPSAVDGLPVLSVSEALARRDAGSSDRLAVFGWALRFFVPCPQPPDAYQPLESCVYGFTWLMAVPEQLGVTNPDGSGSIHPPVGPAFNTTFGPPDAGIPQAVIVIGRFHDPASSNCPAGSRRDACERLFVAEGAAWLGPTSTGQPSASLAPGPSSVPSASPVPSAGAQPSGAS